MPKRADIKKILVIGSGPIVIGQAAEFDYAGTQACLALKEEGYQVILCNSNPATIMTDTSVADRVYMEPLTLEYLAKIIRFERPDAILPGIGGQTGLNLAMQLEKKGVLRECRVEMLGTKSRSIERAEDRELFKELCQELGEPVLPSDVANSLEEGLEIAEAIGYPVVLRPAYTLGGTGGGFADHREELLPLMRNALSLSPVHQVLIEKSIKGYQEIEYEVMRDGNDTAITICNMENLDPVGIHTGDSIVVCPSQTLTNKEYQMLRDSALKIIRALEIEGGCNVQFALDPNSFRYYLIEVNPRVSRSSALASKASGYPIARVSAKIAVGMTLDEIRLVNTCAAFEPALDYVVMKMPRFPFDKFSDANNALGTQMKATGEVMSIGRTFEESLLKAIRSLEIGLYHLYDSKFDSMTEAVLLDLIRIGTDDRIYAIAQLLRIGCTVEAIHEATAIDLFFLRKLRRIVEKERELRENRGDIELLKEAKKMGFSDKIIARLWGREETELYHLRKKEHILSVYKMIDSCAAEFDSYIPYFYSGYEEENESVVSGRKKIIVLGSGPIRIGQGVEFDYSTVHAVQTIRAAGYEAIIINNNPETVSTDYTCSDKLYFEPLCVEDVMHIIELERTGIHSGDSISVYPPFSISEGAKERIIEYTKRLGMGIGIKGLFNIQFIVDAEENVYIIEVNPRSSRTVPFLSKATGYPLADLATHVMLGKSLAEQGIFKAYGKEKGRYYVKAPAFSFSKLKGVDAYLSPEMKSTGEAIGYDAKLHRAMYKAMVASGIKVLNYGTVLVTLADEDKQEALPLIRRFYDLGFNIEATAGTATFLKANGIRSRVRGKLSEGSQDVLESIRAGYVSYVINTRAILSGVHHEDGAAIRRCAGENNVTMFTSLDTVRVLLEVLEERTMKISLIDDGRGSGRESVALQLISVAEGRGALS